MQQMKRFLTAVGIGLAVLGGIVALTVGFAMLDDLGPLIALVAFILLLAWVIGENILNRHADDDYDGR